MFTALFGMALLSSMPKDKTKKTVYKSMSKYSWSKPVTVKITKTNNKKIPLLREKCQPERKRYNWYTSKK